MMELGITADRATMVVLPPKAPQVAEGQAWPRRVRQQIEEKEVKHFNLSDGRLAVFPGNKTAFFKIFVWFVSFKLA